MTDGIVYIATCRPDYLSMSIASALTLRSCGESAPIVIYSDLLPNSIELGNRIAIERISPPLTVGGLRSRWVKTLVNHLSPFEKTLFLDADILPLQPVDNIWNYGGLAMALAHRPTVGECDHISKVEHSYTLDRLPPSTPQFNSGVILFDNSVGTGKFFWHWHLAWQQFKQHDQLALARSIASAGLAPTLLPQKFNQPSSTIDATSILGHYSGANQKHGFWHNVIPKIKAEVNDICDRQLPTI